MIHGRGGAEYGQMARALGSVSDTALMWAVSRWDERALAQLYERHAGVVFGLARRLLGDPGRAEEIVQEVFLRLWRYPERYDPERGTLRSYLLAQAHGRAVDRLRSDTARQRRESRDHSARPTTGSDIDTQVADLLVAEQVRAALDALSVEERKAIELAYFGGHSYRQVAALLGAPEGTVKSRIRSGLRRLRDDLSNAGIGATWLAG